MSHTDTSSVWDEGQMDSMNYMEYDLYGVYGVLEHVE